MTREKRHMSLDDFKVIAGYLTPGQTVGLYMMGEPFTNPAIFDMIRIARERGVNVEIASNSLNSGTAEIRQSILTSGIKYLILDMTLWKESDRVMERAITNIRHMLEDYERMAGKPSGATDLPTIAVQIVSSKDEAWQEFPDWASHAAWKFPGRVLLKRKYLETWSGTVPGMDLRTEVVPPPVRRPCHEPFERVAVLVDGRVVPCCLDAEGKTVYGNLLKTPMEVIWNGAEATRVRNLMLAQQWDSLPEPCKSCKSWGIPMDRRVSTPEGKDRNRSNA
jgi:radical SAM protein with 4Fe4S-binding SPASM domain